MGIRLDLTNQRYGRLVCLKLLDKRNKWGHAIWRCQCDCGSIVEVPTKSLRSKNTRSCGCIRDEQRRLPKNEAMLNSLFSSYFYGAKRRKLEFKLTKEEFKKITKQNCHYCEQPPKQIYQQPRCYGKYIYSGIDRIDNSKGYTFSNCVPCCKLCNNMKKDLPVDVFIKHIKRITKYLSR